MKSGFKDPIKPKKVEPPYKPVDGKDSPWDFRAPQYDQRHSCFVSAGTNYGVGFNQPVGTKTQTSASPIPFGRVDTMSVDTHIDSDGY